MNYWLIKSEPGTWSWDMQVDKGAKGEAWTGVRNHTAKQNLMKMKKGDRAFFYHSVGRGRRQGCHAAQDAGDACGYQGRAEVEGHGARKIVAPVGAAGHSGGVEAGLRDGRGEAVVQPSPGRGPGRKD